MPYLLINTSKDVKITKYKIYQNLSDNKINMQGIFEETKIQVLDLYGWLLLSKVTAKDTYIKPIPATGSSLLKTKSRNIFFLGLSSNFKKFK